MSSQQETEEWARKVFAVLDTLDVSQLSSIISKSAVIKSGNEPALIGVEALQQQFAGLYGFFKSQKHNLIRIDPVRDGSNIYVAAEVSVVFKNSDNETLIVPSLGYFERVPAGEEEAGKVKSLTIYGDMNPVKEKIMKIMGAA